MNTFAQMALVVTLLGALVIKAGIAREGGYEDFMGSIMIAVNIGLGVMFLKFVVWLEISDRLTRMRKEHPLISKSKLHCELINHPPCKCSGLTTSRVRGDVADWRLFAKPDFESEFRGAMLCCSAVEANARYTTVQCRRRRSAAAKSASRPGSKLPWSERGASSR